MFPLCSTKILYVFLILVCSLTVHSNEDFDLSDPDSVIQTLTERRELIRETRAIVCKDSSGFPGRYSHDKNKCKQGDIVLFAGIGCLAAYLAGDNLTAQERCRDVFNSQMTKPIENMDSLNGKWVRGEVALDDPTHFSRDMGLGVMAASVAEFFYYENNPLLERRKDQLMQWIDYISRDPQNGKFMCHDNTPLGIGNRCNIYQGNGYGAQLYRVLYTGNVIEFRGKKRKYRYKESDFDNSMNEFEFSPKLKAKLLNKIRKKYHRYNPKKTGRELFFQFHDGYQIHLKTVELFIHMAMDRKQIEPNIFHKDDFVSVNYKEYNRIAKKVFKKKLCQPLASPDLQRH
ncbi:hypothetical protein N9N67_11075 [Bacteriovoracaceae bacterium]|nr:hypothetical protein [Bacteriovoracaceae bacterium]